MRIHDHFEFQDGCQNKERYKCCQLDLFCSRVYSESKIIKFTDLSKTNCKVPGDPDGFIRFITSSQIAYLSNTAEVTDVEPLETHTVDRAQRRTLIADCFYV
jgi:hypothetical protein